MKVFRNGVTIFVAAFILSVLITIPAKAEIEGQHQTADIDTKTVTQSVVKKMLARFSRPKNIVVVVLGPEVEKISGSAFKGTGVKTIKLDTTKLTKKTIKNSLKGSEVQDIEVLLTRYDGKKRQKYYKKYKTYFFDRSLVGLAKNSTVGIAMASGTSKEDSITYTYDATTNTITGRSGDAVMSRITYQKDVVVSGSKVLFCDDTVPGKYTLTIKPAEVIKNGTIVLFGDLGNNMLAVKINGLVLNNNGTVTVSGTKPDPFSIISDIEINL